MFKNINNNKGYTLTYAIIVIAILSILATSVIAATYFNYKIARTGGYVNNSFYSSDGSIEEAITELNIYTHNAEVAARKYVKKEDFMKEKKEMWTKFLAEIYEDMDDEFISYTEGSKLIANAYQREFDEAFYENLFKNIKIKNEISYKGSNKFKIEKKNSKDVISFKDNIKEVLNIDMYNGNIIDLSGITLIKNNGGFKFNLTATTKHKFNKKIKVEINIVTPKFDFFVATKIKSIELHKNEIIDYALVSNKSIIFKAGSTEITGDINAFSKSYDGYTNLNRNTYKGIIFEEGSLDIKGDLITRSSLVFKKSATELKVTGNIYANAVNIEGNANNVNVTVSDNLYLYSDLFIGGNNASISLGDSKFKHENLSDNINTYVPLNGVIYAINNDNLELSNEYSRNGSIIISEKASNPSIALNGLVLGGTVRYDLYSRKDLFGNDIIDQKPFKTGEGITTFHNKEYYQTLLEDNIYQSGVFSTLQLFSSNEDRKKYYDLIKYRFESDKVDKIDDVKYNANHFYQIGYKAFLENKNESGNLYKKISPEDKKIIKFRDLVQNASDEFYGIFSLGVLSFTKKEEAGKTYHPDRIVDKYEAILETRTKMDKKMNFLGYRDIKGHNTKSTLDDWLNFTGVSDVNKLNNENIIIINKDKDKDIYLNYDGALSNQTKLNGVIVTKGDVYIRSENVAFEFTGTIVAGGNIYFLGSGKKTIIHDEKLVYKTIARNKDLQKLYQTTNGRALSVTKRSDDSSFKTSVGPNANKIIVNFVEDSNLDESGKSLDSTSVIITSWKEID